MFKIEFRFRMSKIDETFIENRIKNPNRNFEVFKICLGENFKEDKIFQSDFFYE